MNHDTSYLRRIPFGGYPTGMAPMPASPFGGPGWGANVGQPMYVGQQGPYPYPQPDPSQYPQPSPYAPRPMSDVLALTLVGLAVFGGAGALIGFLVGGTKQAALVGSLIGLAAPQVGSAIQSMRGG